MKTAIHVGDFVEVNLTPWQHVMPSVDPDILVFQAHVARIELDGSYAVVGDDVPICVEYRLCVPRKAITKLVRRGLPQRLVREANKHRNTPVGELP